MRSLKNTNFFIMKMLFILTAGTTNSQNVYIVHISQPDPIVSPSLIDAGINEENRNELVWEKLGIVEPEYYNIYRSNIKLTEGWKKIGVVYFDDNPQFIDANSNPLTGAYAYSITAVDECGYETPISTLFKSVELDGSKINNNTYSLNWNQLEGVTVNQYTIYRGTYPDSLLPIATTTPDVLTVSDTPPNPDQTYYQIEAIKNEEEIVDTLPKLKKLSNLISTHAINLKNDSMKVFGLQLYPNPFTYVIHIQFLNLEQLPYQIILYDLFGKKVAEKMVSSGVLDLSRGNLNNGIYVLQIRGNKNYTAKLDIQ